MRDGYALYKGDKFIAIGTVNELAKIMNVTPNTIRFYLSPTYRKRIKGNGRIVIKIEDGDE